MTTGERLEELLAELGWSATKLADEAQIDRPAIHKIIKGTVGLGETRAQRIVDAAARHGVTVTVSELLARQRRRTELEQIRDEAESLRERAAQALAQLDQEDQS